MVGCLQSPPHLVNHDATLLQYPLEGSNTLRSPAVVFSSNTSSPWGNSCPATSNSVCQHQLNAETAANYNRQLLEAATGAHQMALRPPSTLDPSLLRAVIPCDAYNPELDAGENPEYFHINSLLFAAHQLRSQRYGRPFFEH